MIWISSFTIDSFSWWSFAGGATVLFDTDLLSSLLARIFLLRGCSSTVFCTGGAAGVVLTVAAGLGALFVVVSFSFDAVCVWLTGLSVLLFCWELFVVLVSVPLGAGDGDELCNCGEELFEPRSTDCPVDPPDRCELLNTLCCARSSAVVVPATLVCLSSTAFTVSTGLAHRDDELSLSVFDSFPLKI